MRTTIRLDDELCAAAKRRALDEGTTLTTVIEDALRESLGRQQPSESGRLRLPTSGEGGLQPGVDLDDSVGLRDTLDGLVS